MTARHLTDADQHRLRTKLGAKRDARRTAVEEERGAKESR